MAVFIVFFLLPTTEGIHVDQSLVAIAGAVELCAQAEQSQSG